MANKIPPVPVGSAPGSAFWNDWYEKLRNLINSGTISQLWSSLDFTASNITDIVTRSHGSLQSFQGGSAGERYHLTAAEHTDVQNLSTSLAAINDIFEQSGPPTITEIATDQWAIYRDTDDSSVRLWVNNSGTMISVLLS